MTILIKTILGYDPKSVLNNFTNKLTVGFIVMNMGISFHTHSPTVYSVPYIFKISF